MSALPSSASASAVPVQTDTSSSRTASTSAPVRIAPPPVGNVRLQHVRMLDRLKQHEFRTQSSAAGGPSSQGKPPAIFHPGQLEVQQKAGFKQYAAGYADWLSSSIHSQEQVSQLQKVDIAYVAFRDNGSPHRRWLTPVTKPLEVDTENNVSATSGDEIQVPLLQVLAANRIRVNSIPPESWNDPLRAVLLEVQTRHNAGDHESYESHPHVSVHIMIEWTRDRMRLSGRVAAVTTLQSHGYDSFEVETDLVVSLCPKYIHDRRIVDLRDEASRGVAATVEQSASALAVEGAISSAVLPLPPVAAEIIRGANTMWLSSGVETWGATASHRGGKPGFVRLTTDLATGSPQIEWGDYVGNKMLHTLGNALVNPAAGATFLDFSDQYSGSILQLSGHLRAIHALEPNSELEHSNRRVVLRIDSWRLVKQALPFRWVNVEESSFNPPLFDPATKKSQSIDSSQADPLSAIRSNATELTLIDVLHPQLWRASGGLSASNENEDVLTFRFTPSRPSASFSGFHFVAGQYATFNLLIDGQVQTRSWTITSVPGSTVKAPPGFPLATSSELPILDISVKRLPGGIASEFIHAAARQFEKTDPELRFSSSRPILSVLLRGIEGKFVLPSAYWSMSVQSPQQTDRLVAWRDGKKKALQRQLANARAAQQPPLRLTLWAGGIGVTPLLAIQRLSLSMLSSSTSSSLSLPSRYTWIYVCQKPHDVIFAEELQNMQRMAISSGRALITIAFFFTQLQSSAPETAGILRSFTSQWMQAVGTCTDQPEHLLVQPHAGRPSLEVLSSFLQESSAYGDKVATSTSATAPTLSSYTHNNFVCGPEGFMQFARTAVEHVVQRSPGTISERVKMEEFNY